MKVEQKKFTFYVHLNHENEEALKWYLRFKFPVDVSSAYVFNCVLENYVKWKLKNVCPFHLPDLTSEIELINELSLSSSACICISIYKVSPIISDPDPTVTGQVPKFW